MRFGLSIFLTDEGPPPAEIAAMVEAHGFDSLFLPEHTNIPAERRTPAPEGGELPSEYSRTLDPFVALAAAAGATERLLLGTGICLLAQRDPILCAKEVASLDLVSGGRFLFGIGAGWNIEEIEAHGVDPRHRFAIMDEYVRAMKEIWTRDEASYEGRWVRFDRLWSWPKPVQKPHPPVLVAVNGPSAEKRTLEIGDEWLPVSRPGLAERIKRFRDEAMAAGKEPPPVTVYGAQPEQVERYAEAGAHRCVFWLPPRDNKAIERKCAELADRLGISAST